MQIDDREEEGIVRVLQLILGRQCDVTMDATRACAILSALLHGRQHVVQYGCFMLHILIYTHRSLSAMSPGCVLATSTALFLDPSIARVIGS
jgi:hypothetical protein